MAYYVYVGLMGTAIGLLLSAVVLHFVGLQAAADGLADLGVVLAMSVAFVSLFTPAMKKGRISDQKKTQ